MEQVALAVPLDSSQDIARTAPPPVPPPPPEPPPIPGGLAALGLALLVARGLLPEPAPLERVVVKGRLNLRLARLVLLRLIRPAPNSKPKLELASKGNPLMLNAEPAGTSKSIVPPLRLSALIIEIELISSVMVTE